ncbi:diaminopimelate decarboxylase [Candidatus Parcubacteria bacterium]|nr:diaminopimelate decarboxylase [Candidatus Parcubacteria bacterium]
MASKALPFTPEEINRLTERFPTPFYLYDEAGIRRSARQLNRSFAWAPDFRNFFAVKATPNPAILKLLAGEGMGADCSSLAELVLAEDSGLTGKDIMFTSNDTPAADYQKAAGMGAIINLDDITHIDYLERVVGLPEVICFRYNPGPARSGNSLIGQPQEAKYGLTRRQLSQAYAIAKQKGVKRFGLHAMVVSNELDSKPFIETAEMLFEIVAELSTTLGIRFEFVNLGGGLGIPYRPDEAEIDLAGLSNGIERAYRDKIAARGLDPLRIVMECGRFLTGPHGFLVAKVLHLKHTYKHYVGLDASMADLMRPGMYGAYHHLSVLGKQDQPLRQRYDVTGPLCENNDKFAIDRLLPAVEVGDTVAIHDAGAHGHAMGFNYNGLLRCAELLRRPDGEVELIRRAETLDDYFATLRF